MEKRGQLLLVLAILLVLTFLVFHDSRITGQIVRDAVPVYDDSVFTASTGVALKVNLDEHFYDVEGSDLKYSLEPNPYAVVERNVLIFNSDVPGEHVVNLLVSDGVNNVYKPISFVVEGESGLASDAVSDSDNELSSVRETKSVEDSVEDSVVSRTVSDRVVSASALSVQVVNGSCPSGFADVLHLARLNNSHVELPNESDFDFRVCVGDNTGRNTITNSSGTVFLRLASSNNSHVELPNESNYGFSAFVDADVDTLSCSYPETGDGTCTNSSQVCLVTVSSEFVPDYSNMHVAACDASYTYETAVCCGLDVSNVCPLNVNSNSVLSSGFVCPDTAVNVTANDVVFDCNGNTLGFNSGGDGDDSGILAAGVSNVTVKNCVISDSSSLGKNLAGINLTSADNVSFINVTIQAAGSDWIYSSSDSSENNFTGVIFKNGNGSINIPGFFQINGSRLISQNELNISNNLAFLNSSELSFLNQSAQVTLSGVSFVDPQPLVDFEDDGSFDVCSSPQCTEISYVGDTFVFNVSSFTRYSSNDSFTGIFCDSCPSCDTCVDTVGAYCVLNTSITSAGTCIDIGADDVILDCNDFKINYDSGGTGGNGVTASNRNNLTVRNCRLFDINSGGSQGYGISFTTVANSSIESNYIQTNGTQNNYGIYLQSNARKNSISGNSVKTNGSTSDNYGIYLIGSRFNSIDDNNVSTYGGTSSNVGIRLVSYAYNNNVTNNEIITSGSTSNFGIELQSNCNESIVENNTITTQGTSSNHGIYVTTNIADTVIRGNTIETSGTQGDGIRLRVNSFRNTVFGNGVITNGGGSYGIRLTEQAHNNTISNNTASATASGISVENSGDNVLRDSLDDFANYSFTSSEIEFDEADGIINYSSAISGTGGNLSDVISISEANVFVNSTAASHFNTSAQVTMRSLINISDAAVEVDYEDDGTFVDCEAPDCVEVSYNASGNNDFIFNVSRFTTYRGVSQTNITVILIQPLNNSIDLQSLINFSCNATATDLTNITLYQNLNGTYLPYQTTAVSGNNVTVSWLLNLSDFIGNNSIKDSTYSWNCLACDSVEGCGYADSNGSFSGWELGTANKAVLNFTSTFYLTENDTEKQLPDSNSYDGFVNMTDNVLLLHFDDALNDLQNQQNVTDSSSFNNTGTCDTVYCPVRNSSGRIGFSYDFDGFQDEINFGNPTSLKLDSSLTIGLWWKTNWTPGAGENYRIFGRADNLSQPDTQHSYSLFSVENSGKVRFVASNGGSSASVNSSSELDDGEWHLVVGVFDPDVDSSERIKLYVDGVLEGVASFAFTSLNNFDEIKIGQGNGGYVQGSVDEAFILNSSMTPQEVRFIYDRQKGRYINRAKYTSRVFDIGFDSVWENLTWDVPFYYYGTELADNKKSELLTGGIDMSSNILLLHLNEQSGAIIDSSGSSNDGSVINQVQYGANGKLNTSLGFNSNGYVNFTDAAFDTTTSVSLGGWVKLNSSALGDGQGIIWKNNSYGLAYGDTNKGGNQNELAFFVSNLGTFTLASSGRWEPLKEWQHVVGVFDDTNDLVKLYINGKLINSTPFTQSITESNAPLTVGSDNGNSLLNGTLDEMFVMSKALSDTEVLNIYKRGALYLNISVRGCDYPSCNETDYHGPYTNANLSSIYEVGRYFQYVLDFETTDDNLTPELLPNSVKASGMPNGPRVTLEIPVDDNNTVDLTSNVTFNCSATGNGIGALQNASLYHNINGSWVLYGVIDLPGNAASAAWSINPNDFYPNAFRDSLYDWNCKVYDAGKRYGWYKKNKRGPYLNATFSGWDLGDYYNVSRNTTNRQLTLNSNESGQYPNTTGYYYSRVYDAGYVTQWRNVTWDEDVNQSLGNITVAVRACTSPACNINFGSEYMNGSAFVGSRSRYMQYRVTLNSTSNAYTPIFLADSITINYSGAPPNITTVYPNSTGGESFDPAEIINVTIAEPQNQTFNITFENSSPVNITWSVDGVEQTDYANLTEFNWSGNYSQEGSYLILVNVSNANGFSYQYWNLTVNNTQLCPYVFSASTILSENISCPATAAVIFADDIILDCNGSEVEFGTAGGNFVSGIIAENKTNVTIRNCVVVDGNTSGSNTRFIDFISVNDSTLRNNSIVSLAGSNTDNNRGIRLIEGNSNVIYNNTVSLIGNSFNYGVYFLNSSSSNNVSSNVVSSSGIGSNQGIRLETAANNNFVFNNTVNTSGNGGDDNFGIYLINSSENNISENTIGTDGRADNNGVYLITDANKNTVFNNTIRTSGTGNRNIGVRVETSLNNSIDGNDMRTGPDNSNYGVYIYDSASGNNITNNVIVTNASGTSNHGIYVERTLNNTVIAYNDVNASGSSSYGIYLYDFVSHSRVIENTVRTFGGFGPYGIVLEDSSNISIERNNITANGTTGSFGIYALSSSSNNVTGNKVVTDGDSQNYGIILEFEANDNRVGNNVISTAGSSNNNYGIYLYDTLVRNNVSGNNISTAGTSDNYGLYFESDANYNELSDNFINTEGALSYAVYFVSSSANNTLESTVLNDTVAWILSDSSSVGNNFTDTTFQDGNGSINVPGLFQINGEQDINRSRLNISYNAAFLNSSNLSFLNQSARITLNGITYSDPQPIVDFEDDGSFDACTSPQCTEVSFIASSYVFDVASFTTYSTIMGGVNISLSKTDSRDPLNLAQGTLLNYSLLINISDGIAYNLTLNESYPAQVNFVSASPAPDSGNNIWNFGNVTSPSVIDVNITVNVSTSTPNGTVINNTANITFQNSSGSDLSLQVVENTTVLLGNSTVTTFDDTDNETRTALEQVYFYGNYSDDQNQSINGTDVYCEISFDLGAGFTDDANMTFNDTSTLYQYNRSFATKGTYPYRIVCDGTAVGYGTAEISEDANVSNSLPNIDQVILNSTDGSGEFGNASHLENLTAVFINVTDIDGDSVKNITNWFVNDTSITILNMPFEGHSALENETAKDYSPYGNNGTVNGAVWNQTGGFDGFSAYNFDGNSDYVDISDSESLKFGTTQDFTIAVWIRRFASNSQFIIDRRSADDSGYTLLLRNDDSVGFYVNSQDAVSTGTITDDSWHFLAAVADRNGNSQIYIDGQPDGSVDISSAGSLDQVTVARVGARSHTSPDSFFNGTIDEVMIFNRSLSPEQILALYNNQTNTIVSNETSLGDVWRLEVTPNDGDNNTDGATRTSNNVTILDDTAPLVFDLVPSSGTTYNHSETIEIGANVTDDGTLDTVRINITLPDNSVYQDNLSPAGGDFFNTSYTIPILNGTYYVTFIANDTYGNVNSTEVTFFVGFASECGLLTTDTTLINDVSSTGTCFTFGADDITLDCNSHDIEFDSAGTGGVSGIIVPGWDNVTVKNCVIRDINANGANGWGINVTNSTNSSFINNTIYTNGTNDNYGMRLQNGVESNSILNSSIYSFGTGNNNHAISLRELADDNYVAYNVINSGSSASDFNHGISLAEGVVESPSGNEVFYNNISTRGSNANYGINFAGVVIGVNNNNVSGNIFETEGVSSYAARFASASGNTLTANLLNDTAEWILSDSSSNTNNFTNTTFQTGNGSIMPFFFQINGSQDVNRTRLDVINNSAFLNSSNLTFLNVSARITLNGINFLNPLPIVDFEDDGSFVVCDAPQCIERSFTGSVFTFDVQSFSNYSTTETLDNLTLIKVDSPDPVIKGQQLNYTINISNDGTATMFNATLNDTLPAGVVFDSSQPAADIGNTFFVLGNITSGESLSINITVNVSSALSNGTVLTNTVNLTFTNSSNDTVSAITNALTTVLGFPVVSSFKFDSPDPVPKGSQLNYQINVSNSGDNTAFAVNVTESYPAGVIFDSSQPAPSAGDNVFSIGNLGPISSYLINITVNVSPALSNGTVLNNNYNVTFGNATGEIITFSNSTSTTVLGSPVIVAIKSDSPDPVLKGGQLNYSIVVNNTGDDAAFNVSLVEFYPAGTIFDSSSPLPSSGNDTFSVGDLGANSSATINITVNVSSGLVNGSVLNNVVNVTYSNVSSQNATVSDSELTTVRGERSMVVSKVDSPDPAPRGSQLSYQLNVTNVGDDSAFNVSLVEFYPVGVVFDSAQPVPAIGNNIFNLPDLAPIESFLLNITVNVSSGLSNGTVLNNSAVVNGTNFFGTVQQVNVSETTSVLGSPVIVAVKSDSPDPVAKGQQLSYVIEVNNTGDDAAFNVSLEEFYPAGVVFDSSSPVPTAGNDTFVLGSIAPNESVFVNITVNVSSALVNGTVLTNNVNVTFANSSGQNDTVSDSESTTVVGYPEISTFKTGFPDPVPRGSQLTYQINLTNVGDDTAFNVNVTESYPVNVSFHSSSPSPVIGNNVFSVGTLSPGESFAINITVNVSNFAPNGSILNNSYVVDFANVSGLSASVGNSTLTTVTGVPVVVAVKSDSPDPVARGEQLTYSILVNNTGDEVARNVTVNESYPAGVVFNNSQPAPSFGNNAFNLGDLAPGDGILINITVNVSSALASGTVLNNTINASYINITNATVLLTTSELTTVVGIPNVSFSKNASSAANTSSNFNYTLTVQNSGDYRASSVIVTETYPSGVNFVSSQPAPSSGNNVFNLGNIAAGETFVINITVRASTPGAKNNTASLSFTNSTGITVLDSASALTNVTGAPAAVPAYSGGLGGRGGGGGGGVAPRVFYMENTTYTSPPLRRLDKVMFDIGGEEHSLQLTRLAFDSLTFVIESGPQVFTLLDKQAVLIDVNNDGTPDLQVKVLNLQSPVAVLYMAKLHQPELAAYDSKLVEDKPAKTPETTEDEVHTSMPVSARPEIQTPGSSVKSSGSGMIERIIEWFNKAILWYSGFWKRITWTIWVFILSRWSLGILLLLLAILVVSNLTKRMVAYEKKKKKKHFRLSHHNASTALEKDISRLESDIEKINELMSKYDDRLRKK